MTAEELKGLIAEGDATLAVLQTRLRDAMATLRNEPSEIEVEVFHGRVSKMVRKPHPAMRRLREIGATIRSLELRLKELREEEKAVTSAQELANSHFARWAPKEIKNENA